MTPLGQMTWDLARSTNATQEQRLATAAALWEEYGRPVLEHAAVLSGLAYDALTRAIASAADPATETTPQIEAVVTTDDVAGVLPGDGQELARRSWRVLIERPTAVWHGELDDSVAADLDQFAGDGAEAVYLFTHWAGSNLARAEALDPEGGWSEAVAADFTAVTRAHAAHES